LTLAAGKYRTPLLWSEGLACCYDHRVGRLGVALTDAFVKRGYALLCQDGGIVTARGEAFFAVSASCISTGNELSADPASTGANAARIWQARSALPWPDVFETVSIGWNIVTSR
jgi:hypothetical protein